MVALSPSVTLPRLPAPLDAFTQHRCWIIFDERVTYTDGPCKAFEIRVPKRDTAPLAVCGELLKSLRSSCPLSKTMTVREMVSHTAVSSSRPDMTKPRRRALPTRARRDGELGTDSRRAEPNKSPRGASTSECGATAAMQAGVRAAERCACREDLRCCLQLCKGAARRSTIWRSS